MATMQATSGHSKACCNTVPVVPDKYEPKGQYEDLGGMSTYFTGPADATKGLILIPDIFCFVNQTLQGADILATGGKQQKYKVFVPDCVNGDPASFEWFPPDTPEKQQKLGGWFGQHNPGTVANALPDYVKALQKANPSIKSWGVFGFCWGGKIVEIVTCAHPDVFSVAGSAHPAMIDPSGAEKVTVPYILLASGEESADEVKAFQSKLKVPHHVETFDDQVHGFMAARADLSDSRVLEEYARGYTAVLDFFDEHWK